MKVIHRFEIPMDEAALNEGQFSLELPRDAVLLHVAVQDRAPHAPCMWFSLDEESEPEVRHFAIVGTGHPHLLDTHVATWQQHGFVWHLFELTTVAELSQRVLREVA